MFGSGGSSEEISDQISGPKFPRIKKPNAHRRSDEGLAAEAHARSKRSSAAFAGTVANKLTLELGNGREHDRNSSAVTQTWPCIHLCATMQL